MIFEDVRALKDYRTRMTTLEAINNSVRYGVESRGVYSGYVTTSYNVVLDELNMKIQRRLCDGGPWRPDPWHTKCAS